jgi:hypothetical protein
MKDQPRLRRRIAALLLIACLVPAAPVIAAGTLYTPPNRWLKLITVPTERFVAERFVDCSPSRVLSNPVGRRASGFVFGDGGVFYFGGGGQNYPGNDVEFYDVLSNTWLQQYPPECLPACCVTDNRCHPACAVAGGTGTTALTPLGRPYVEHAYRLVTYDPARRVFFATLSSGTWTWERDGDWTLLTPNVPHSTGIHTKTVAYDAGLNTELFFATTATRRVFAFDWDSLTWVDHGMTPGEVTSAEIYSAYDPVARKHLVSHLGATGTFWLYDAEAPQWVRLESSPPEVLRASSLDYDPETGVFVVAQTATGSEVELWTYDVAGDLWMPLDPLGTPPMGSMAGRFGTLVYDDVAERFLFMNVKSVTSTSGSGGSREGDVETWSYRIGALGEQICVGDCNWDGELSSDEIDEIISRIFTVLPPEDCEAIELDETGRADAATLVHALRVLAEGCGRDFVPGT